jgi:DNA sulfur modification protein DndD
VLFDRLSIFNFQRYSGKFEINFPNPDKQTSLVLVLAPNNTGKTTIIRALRFFLYGDIGNRNNTSIWELVNERVRASAKTDEVIKAWVEARIRIGDQEPITVRRSISIRRLSGHDKWAIEGPTLAYRNGDRAEEKFRRDDGLIQSRMRRAVPEELFSWFYFHGEPAGGKMAHGGAEGLRVSLQKVIQLQRWSDSIETVEALITKIQREQASEMGASQEFNRLIKQIEIVQDGLKSNKEALKSYAGQEAELKEEIDDLDARIDNLAKAAEDTQAVLTKLRHLESLKQKAQSKADRATEDYKRAVSNAAGLPFLSSIFNAVDKRLSGLRKNNLLPVDVSKSFIERLLNAPACVCGRVHDEKAISHLQKFLESSVASQTNADLLNLANRLDKASGSPYRSAIRNLPNELSRLRAEEVDSTSSVAQCSRQLDEIKPPDDSSTNGFQELLRQKRIKDAKLSNLISERLKTENTMLIQEQSLKKLRDEFAKIAPKNKLGKVDRLNQEYQKAKALLDALQQGQEKFKSSVATILQAKLSELFDASVTGGNKARLDNRTLLPAIATPDGRIEKDTGGGEKQVLELAYVIALAELRTIINKTVRDAGLGGNLLGPQSFILDSPFTSVDPNYMRVIAEFLPGKTHQMILLVAKQNWHDTIRTALEPHFTDAHAITLHTSTEIKEPEAYLFEFRGKQMNLLKKLPGKETSFTTFRQI